MSIARFENITVNRLTFGSSSFGEQSTTITKWFDTRARVHSVSNTVRISDRYRVYADIVEFTLNYTPNTKEIIDNQNLFSIKWKNLDWRLDSVREADDRMTVRFMCVRNDPVVAA
jgi:hypothetical protein